MENRALGRRVITPQQAFDRIGAAIRPILTSSGYVEVSSELQPEDFGSQVSTYTSPQASVQLTWNGKGEFFVLECDRLPNETVPGGWIDLTLQGFDPRRGDDQWVKELCEDISAALRSYAEQWT